jgi:methyl-accepting chemotaxis protein
MSSKYEEMKAASKRNLEEAQDIPTMVCVTDTNWQAVISQLELLTDTLLEVKVRTDETMTYEQMKWHLENQQTILDQVLESAEKIRELTSQNVTAEVTKLNQAAKDLSSQAGKLNEQTLSQLKCSDEQNRKHGLRLLTAVAVIEFLHLISSVSLLLWLR